MMKKYKVIIISLLANITILSCYVDKGNYEYTPISDIEISGIETSYSKISAIDTLKISPIITSSYGNNLEYTWLIYDASNKVDTLGKEKNLSFFITKPSGNYAIYLYVKSKANGYYVHANTSLTVGTQFTRGHYILKENSAGNTDMDLLLDDDRFMSNILQNTQGEALSGAPRSLGILYGKQIIDPVTLNKTSTHCLGVITYNKKVSILRASDMRKIFDHSTMFYEEPTETPYKLLTGFWANKYLSSLGTYSTNVTTPGSGILGFPSGVPGGSDHWAFSSSLWGMVYWDETNNRILWNNYNGQASVINDVNYATSNLNYNCLFMGAFKGVVYGLFRDKSNSTKLYLYRLTTSSSSRPPVVNKVTEIVTTSKLHSATLFACNQFSAEIIYFVSNNKLYYYDAVNNAEYEINAQGLPSNETITFIANRRYTITTPNFDYFTVATYNSGTYKVFMYNMVGGLPNGLPVRTKSGTGKVKETHYLGTYFDYFDLVMGRWYSR